MSSSASDDYKEHFITATGVKTAESGFINFLFKYNNDKSTWISLSTLLVLQEIVKVRRKQLTLCSAGFTINRAIGRTIHNVPNTVPTICEK